MKEKDKAVVGREPTTYGFERQRLTTTPLRPVVFYKIERRHLCLRPTGRSGVDVSSLNLKHEMVGLSIGLGFPPRPHFVFFTLTRRRRFYNYKSVAYV